MTVDPAVGAVTDPDGGALSTETATVDEAVFPAVSLATAVRVWVPSETVVVSQLNEYGVVVSATPRFCPSSWKWPFATPTLSVALAATVTICLTRALFVGAVMETDGGVASGPPTTGVFMSIVIWAAVRAAL